MKVTVSKKASFDAAHYLPDHPGKCRDLHGHTWTVEVGVSGKVRQDTGMVVDFSWLKKVLQEEVVNRYDHQLLNNYFNNPTAENIANHILVSILDNWTPGPEEGLGVEFVRVWEAPDSCVEVRG